MVFFRAYFILLVIIFLNMAEKFYKNEKFQKIFYAVLYFALAVTFAITGASIFHNRYYTSIYVSGSSMMPTLIGNTTNRVHYGISDNHEKALRSLKRFDVVITYYPWNIPEGSTDEVYKIKRVWGFPGETISLSFDMDANKFTFTASSPEAPIYTITAPVVTKEVNSQNWNVAEFITDHKTFYTHAYNTITDGKREFTVTLDKDKQEYFLMGDNWLGSTDSYSHRNESKRITFDDLQGKVVCIEGTAKVNGDELLDKQKIKPLYYF